jgi:hypothetical protein
MEVKYSIRSKEHPNWNCDGSASDEEAAKRITNRIIESLTKRYEKPSDLEVKINGH